eukprot:TRINITY_DN4465_c0_g1_i2.p1 TRINITY_DN4465_c0_g1~~TRINITY_DN4465_c0_g1_i2.p1  ORF type:complete len:548 (+),score=149.41 TRINITY_DN4465_c0_g1_i2:167-1810(+)
MEKDTGAQKQFADALRTFNVFTSNGAITNESSGSNLVNYFALAGNYRAREQDLVDADLEKIWAESPLVTLRMIFYFRIVSRKEKGFVTTEKVQKGQGSRDEFRKSLHWLARNHPQELYDNLEIVPVVGSWKDLWHPYLLGTLDQQQVFALIKKGMDDTYNVGLLAKYLPAIKSSGKISKDNADRAKQNQFAKSLAKYLKLSPTEYRKFKSNKKYTAHEFQRIMCEGKWDQLKFERVPGKALFQLVSGKGSDGKNVLERHDQIARYTSWIASQPVAKFTGYVYELFVTAKAASKPAEVMTYNKQFDGLIELAKKDEGGISGNVWCALDTSGSMQSAIQGLPKITAYDICLSLGIYFAELNTGAFHNNVIMFDSVSYVKQLSGTFKERITQLTTGRTAWGGTNFESVINEIVNLRTSRPEIPVSDFPQTLIVVSDMQFNPVGGNAQTNYKNAMEKLRKVGLPNMRFIWWFVTQQGTGNFPSTIEDEGVTMIGGFDGSIVTMLLGGETKVVDKVTGKERQMNAYENMLKALDQEVLKEIKISGGEEKKEK